MEEKTDGEEQAVSEEEEIEDAAEHERVPVAGNDKTPMQQSTGEQRGKFDDKFQCLVAGTLLLCRDTVTTPQPEASSRSFDMPLSMKLVKGEYICRHIGSSGGEFHTAHASTTAHTRKANDNTLQDTLAHKDNTRPSTCAYNVKHSLHDTNIHKSIRTRKDDENAKRERDKWRERKEEE